ncbi:Clavaminate synthase-like protein [Mycena crocata]|nr:Clavaminate synthase-like protein [Mycena crocata]
MTTAEDTLKSVGIEVVDFAPFLDGSDKEAVADAIISSCKTAGFVYLINHGISPERVAEMFATSKEFFALPIDVKKCVTAPSSTRAVRERGHTPIRMEHFGAGRDNDKEQPSFWLDDDILPGFRECFMSFFEASATILCHAVQFNILRAFALGLCLPEEYFHQYHKASDNHIGLLYYPSLPAKNIESEVSRLRAHSDYDSLTLLLQDECGGLEIEDRDVPGLFRPVPPIPDALIVNVGDFMMHWSNDTLRSAVHRVRPPSSACTSDGMVPARYSIPYDYDTVVDCIPGTWDAERPKKYKPMSVREYLAERLSGEYLNRQGTRITQS